MKGGTNMEEIIKKLTELSKTIATMESCTGGAVANSITNIEGASLVFKFGAVTYSNEYKIKWVLIQILLINILFIALKPLWK